MTYFNNNEIVNSLMANMNLMANQSVNFGDSFSNPSHSTFSSSNDFNDQEFRFRTNNLPSNSSSTSCSGETTSNCLTNPLVLADILQGVTVEETQLTVVVPKEKEHLFQFRIRTSRNLKSIILLDQFAAPDFSLNLIECYGIVHSGMKYTTANFSNNDQEWYAANDTAFYPYICLNQIKIYQVLIKFHGRSIYGKFQKNIIFDFNDHPFLFQQIEVNVRPGKEEIERKISSFVRTNWDGSSYHAINFIKRPNSWLHRQENEWENSLKRVYDLQRINSYLNNEPAMLNKNNYKNVMHSALVHEENCRFQIINSLNHKVTLKVMKEYRIEGFESKLAVGGEYFALMPLDEKISEDTLAGKLIVRSCTAVLLVICNQHFELSKKVKTYESLIEDKTKKALYLRLSEDFVDEYDLMDLSTIDVYAQFQLNRSIFCEMHYAIDQIDDTDNINYLFPTVPTNFKLPWSPKLQFSTYNASLNAQQKEAVLSMMKDHSSIESSSKVVPPILLLGPFGTGKTYTFSVAIKTLLLDSMNDNRILLCTHSNSAADLYILEYFDMFFESNKDKLGANALMRIYYRNRNINTVSSIVKRYCKIENNHFVTPTLEEVMNAKIIITTLSTSFILSMLKVQKGFFSHIFIDEAAQVMECESLIPIILSDQKTRLILAGDHMQMNQEIYSEEARSCHFDFSLLQRLQMHYSENSPLKIILQENFRSHEVIVQFTSELFYNNQLVPRYDQIRHNVYHPLTFFATKGEEVFADNATSYHNDSEVNAIVTRIIELRSTWPVKDWGVFNENSIGVITPYFSQVIRIRKELRFHHLNNVSVERVFNVQGKEFRVVILSTVRTRKTCQKNSEDDYAFLSDYKLLNTAFTRAKSLIICFGDPVTLCTIGKCQNIWQKYLYSCHINKSLFGITWNCLKLSFDYLEHNKQFPLNPAAKEFFPKAFFRDIDEVVNDLQPINPMYFYQPQMPMINLQPVNSQYIMDNMNSILFHNQVLEVLTSDLLPKGYSWFDMLKHAKWFQDKWCNLLCDNFGVNKAYQFKMTLSYFQQEEERCRSIELEQSRRNN